MMKTLAAVPNPATPAGRKPVELITDRAKRYRAQAVPIEGPRICAYCGAAPKRLDREHINGNEADNTPDNLCYACRRCNTAKGLAYARLGLGTKTAQYNPSRKRGSSTSKGTGRRIGSLKAYMAAMSIARGVSKGDKDKAWTRIMELSPAERSQYARELYDLRRRLGTAPPAQEAIPF